MSDINIRDVDDEIKRITDSLARAENLSTSAYIRRLLRENAQAELRRRSMREAEQRIEDIHKDLHIGSVDSDGAVREIRDQYDRTGTGE